MGASPSRSSEQLGLGYAVAGFIFGGVIALITLGYYAKILNPVFAFWAAYILTRPLGASMGDYLTPAHEDGGLGFATMSVSGFFRIIIIGLVAYLTNSGVDRGFGRLESNSQGEPR